MPRGGTWGKPYPTFGNTAVVPVVPFDIATLITNLGVTPLGIYDARYGLSLAQWFDARGGTNPTVVYTVGGPPTISGIGATTTATFTSAQAAGAIGAIASPPATGASIFYVGTVPADGLYSFFQWAAPVHTILGVAGNGSFIAANYFLNTTSHFVNSSVVESSTARALAISGSYAGVGTAQVDAGGQASGATSASTPTGVGDLVIAGAVSAAAVQAVIFLPGLYTAGQFSTFTTWATANHTYT